MSTALRPTYGTPAGPGAPPAGMVSSTRFQPGGQRPGEEAPPPAAPSLAELLAAAPTESAVLHIEKIHNQPWCGMWLALDLDMWFAVIGQAGRSVGASVTFYEEQNGRPLRARMHPYVDAAGNVSVYTKPVRIETNRRLSRARLKVPYRAFPWPSRGLDYVVRANVQLLRLEPNGTVAAIGEGSTTFTIHVQRDCLKCTTASQDRKAAQPYFVRALGDDIYGMFDEEMIDPEAGPRPSPRGGWDAQDWFEFHWPESEQKDCPPEPQRCRAVGPLPSARCSPR